MLIAKTMSALCRPLVQLSPVAAVLKWSPAAVAAVRTERLMATAPRPAAEAASPDQMSKKQVQEKIKAEVHFAAKIQDKDVEKTVLVEELNSLQKTTWSPHEAALPHPIWNRDQVSSVQITHKPPQGAVDRLAYIGVKTLRLGFDVFSGYLVRKKLGTLDEKSVLTRAIFLETVAGVPGFAGGMIRHLHSLRRMERDQGWIHTLLEEAENERMHLMTFLELRRPGPLFRGMVIATQWIFTGGFSLAYLISPHFCHRFVGYLEEEAVVTYTDILHLMDTNQLPMWSILPAPHIAISYWRLDPEAKMRDVILAIRADEAHHRRVNHTLGDIGEDDHNPFKPGQ